MVNSHLGADSAVQIVLVAEIVAEEEVVIYDTSHDLSLTLNVS